MVKRTLGGVPAELVGHHLQGDGGPLGQFKQMLDLSQHQLPAANWSMQDGLVDDRPQFGCIRSGEQRLASQSHRDLAIRGSLANDAQPRVAIALRGSRSRSASLTCVITSGRHATA
jgi:hypothetical protein